MSRGTNIWKRFEQNAGRCFGDAAIKYLKEFDGKDIQRQRYALRALAPYIKDTRLIDIDNDALEVFKEDRWEGKGAFVRPAMAGTINKELTVVTTVLNRACRDWRWLPSVPRIRLVKGPTRVAYPLTWDEQDKLFSCLPPGWNKGAAQFAVNTGVRKSELFGLKWKDKVDIPSLGTFVFILRDTKNGKDRAVICNSLAREACSQNGSDYVFPSHHRGLNGNRLSMSNTIWRYAWAKAGLPEDPLIRKGIHNLRHTFAHRLRAWSVPDEDRNSLMGHNNSSLSEHYALPDLERLSEMAERVTERKEIVVLRPH